MTAALLTLPTAGVVSLRRLAQIVGAARVDLASEAQAQADMAEHLAACLPDGCGLSKEHRLGPAERPDFWVDGRYVVEMKLGKAAGLATWRQLRRYAQHEAVQGVILAGSRGLGDDAARQLGKPFLHVNLGRAWL